MRNTWDFAVPRAATWSRQGSQAKCLSRTKWTESQPEPSNIADSLMVDPVLSWVFSKSEISPFDQRQHTEPLQGSCQSWEARQPSNSALLALLQPSSCPERPGRCSTQPRCSETPPRRLELENTCTKSLWSPQTFPRNLILLDLDISTGEPDWLVATYLEIF